MKMFRPAQCCCKGGSNGWRGAEWSEPHEEGREDRLEQPERHGVAEDGLEHAEADGEKNIDGQQRDEEAEDAHPRAIFGLPALLDGADGGFGQKEEEYDPAHDLKGGRH